MERGERSVQRPLSEIKNSFLNSLTALSGEVQPSAIYACLVLKITLLSLSSVLIIYNAFLEVSND